MYSKVLFFMATSLMFVACSNEAPNCTDSDTKDLVIQIANGELVKNIGESRAKTIELSLETIITKDVNEKVGSYKCSANLKMTGPGGSNSIPITYTSELANDGEDFYVNVYGL